MTIETPVFKVSANGITAPSYPEILEYFKTKAQGIFGDDINLDEDTQDGQLLAIFAAAIHDVNSQAVEVFSAYNPQTAYGVALDSAIKTNGLTRRDATHSTVDLVVVGQMGTVINSGEVKDSFDNIWQLPATVIIPSAGQITVTAKAKEAGAISANANSVNVISTPTRGWQSVNNPAAAIEGVDVETDEELRSEQALSTMQPSMGLWDGLVASLRQVDGVTSVAGRHNDTGSTSTDGIPAHSIACVVSGGEIADIVKTIYLKKSQGVRTYGAIYRDYIDDLGSVSCIYFSRPTDVRIRVAMQVKASSTWISTVEDDIKDRVRAYINGLGIGVSVNIPRVLAAAIKTSDGGYDTDFNVEAISINSASESVAIAWNQIADCALADITITVT